MPGPTVPAALAALAWLAQASPYREWVPPLDNPDNNVRKSDREMQRDQRRPDGKGGWREEHPGFSVHVAPDGAVKFRDRKAKWTGLGAIFDLTDFVMRLHGEDPYGADKRKMLDQTRGERVAMRAEDRRLRIAAALRDLPALLDAVWSAPALAAPERRRVIFRFWDECAEKGEPEVLQAAAQARDLIVRFIQQRLPRGSAGAYPDAELAALNASRKAGPPFAPYAVAPVPPAPGAPTAPQATPAGATPARGAPHPRPRPRPRLRPRPRARPERTAAGPGSRGAVSPRG